MSKINSPCVIHIGQGKCGSTSLQRFLATNSEGLHNNGYIYPRPIDDSANHRILALWLIDQWRPLPTGSRIAAFPQMDVSHAEGSLSPIEHLRLQIQESEQKTILSSEGLMGIDPIFLEKYFVPGSTKIVIYVREQLEYLRSAYAQIIHAKKVSQSFEEYFNRNWSLDYSSIIKFWCRSFGQDQVIPRIYDRACLREGDICRDFLELLDMTRLDNFTFPSLVESNPSIGGPLLKFKLLLNSVTEWDERQLMLKTYRGLQACAALEQRFRTKLFLAKRLEEMVRSKYQASNEKLFENYFPELSGFQISQVENNPEDERLSADDFEYICMLLQDFYTKKGMDAEKNNVIDVHYKKIKAYLN